MILFTQISGITPIRRRNEALFYDTGPCLSRWYGKRSRTSSGDENPVGVALTRMVGNLTRLHVHPSGGRLRQYEHASDTHKRRRKRE